MGGPGKTGTACSHEEGHLFACTVHFMSTSAVIIGDIFGTYEMYDFCILFAYINPVTPYTN